MRITNNLLIHNMLWNMNNNLVSMNEKQIQLATGKKIHKPSDDPVGTTRVIKVKSDIVENLQYKDNVRDAQSWLDVSENSLTDTKDIIQRIRELAVQGANDTYTAAETDKIAKEIDQLLEELIVNANSTIAGRYLFSGFKTDTKLMNKDGTYNIDITSEKMAEFQSIAYEVSVGEYMPVGTNYLDVYGIVKDKNTIIDSFFFGDAREDDSQFTETRGSAATHSKVQFPFDYKVDLTGATTTVDIDGVTYTLEATKLTGAITQEEFTDILSDAVQTSAPVPTPAPTLGDVAEVYFISGDDPSNADGELVIEAKVYGATTMNVAGMKTFTLDTKLPEIINGVAEVLPVHGKIDGEFDYSQYFDGGTLSFNIAGDIYTVDTSEIDDKITDAKFVEILESAVNSQGDELTDIVNITFASTSDDVGTLTIETKTPFTGAISIVDSSNGYQNYPLVRNGVVGPPSINSKLEGLIDLTKDISASVAGDLSFTFDGVTYEVATGTMDGTRTPAQVITLIENAQPSGGGAALSTVANVSFSNAANPYNLVVEAQVATDDIPESVDNSELYLSTITFTDGVGAVEGVNAKISGAIDHNKNVLAGALAFTIGGTTYTVPAATTSGMTGAQVQTLIESATDGGTLLSSVATVTVDDSVDPYQLTIEATTAADDTPVVLDTGGLFSKNPYSQGSVSDTNAVITGTGKITDAMLVDAKRGIGTQSFVVTFNDETKRIDVDLSKVTTMAEMKTAIDIELSNAFGDDGGSPSINNVTFDIVSDGTNDVIQFTGSGKNDGSQTYLKVDVIKSSKPKLIQDVEDFSKALTNKDNEAINKFLGDIDDHMDNILSVMADIGAKTNRLEFIGNRIDDNNIAMTEILSKVQDIDYAEVTIQFKSLESIYRASLSVGAKVIQPTLVDFIK